MKIKQLGNNGGLGDPTATNSAFLIDLYDDHSEYLLFDIGYNVMARLVEEEANDNNFEISKIKHVVVSHKHDDHCGNLETLIYWNHFKNNVQMDIYVADKGLAKTVKDTRKIVDNFNIVKAKTYNSLQVVPTNSYFHLGKYDAPIVYFSPANHGAKAAVGVLLWSARRSFFISGDTKALPVIEKLATDCDIVFHDYSNWDDESKNVHACKTDFEREYSQQFKDRVTKYHTGSPTFNEDWQ